MQAEIQSKILVIEDDTQLSFFVRTILEREGYLVKALTNGTDGLREALNEYYSLILLDINLPGKDGISICKKVRTISDVPIIMFTAQGQIYEKVAGLDSGANDYITKPVEVAELLARVRAHLRNTKKNNLNIKDLPQNISSVVKERQKSKFVFNGLILDTETREVVRDFIEIHLSPKEFEILLFFMKNPNKTLTKKQVFEEIWGSNFNNISDRRIIDEHTNNLKKKINLSGHPKLIYTIHGVGHILK
jgi:two-component system response regulator ArlR